MLFPVFGRNRRFPELSRWSPRSSILSVDSGAPVDGVAITSISDIGRDHELASQTSPVDQPILDEQTVPGLKLLTFTGTQHLQASQSSRVRAVLIEFYLPATAEGQAFISRATDAATTKASFEIGLA